MKDSLSFSSSQKKGIILLMIILFAILILNMLLPGMIRYPRVDHATIVAEIEKYSDSLLSVEKEKPINEPARSQARKDYPNPKAAVPAMVDLNRCDTSALISLPGIGPVFASRIVRYRDLLGGFHSVDQLLEVYGMDSERLQGFREQVTVDARDVKKINVNRISFSDLLRHPYLEYDDVRMIFRKRDQKGVLDQFAGFDTLFPSGKEQWQKVAPYLHSGDPYGLVEVFLLNLHLPINRIWQKKAAFSMASPAPSG